MATAQGFLPMLDLGAAEAPLGWCSADGTLHQASAPFLELLKRAELLWEVPAALPVDLWRALESAESGAAVEYRPPQAETMVIGCTRYPHGEGYLLMMKEIAGVHAALSRRLHRERLEAMGRLVAGIAHEVRNSVASIVYSADYLAFAVDSLTREAVSEAARDVLASSDRIQQTVDGLLEYARLGPSNSGPVSIRELMVRAQGFIGLIYRKRNHELVSNIPSDAEWTLGNSHTVEQIFVNLLLNAAQAASEGLHVEVRAARVDGDRLEVRVIDDGPGIPEELRGSAFLPFFTTREDATGLGLTNAREAAISLGGDLVHEPTDTGTCMMVTLPATSPPPGAS